MNVYGLIGNPLGHSFSKQYFTEKFEKENLRDCRFDLYPLQHIHEFPSLIEKETELKGLAVTIPYKETVIPFLNAVDEEAEIIGAVNCIKITDGKLTGYNTDIIGFEKSIKPLLRPFHGSALILGSGGSSKAVQFVLKKLGINFLIVSRDPATDKRFINYDSIDKQILNTHKLIINCTPMGMFPDITGKPALPYHLLDERNLMFDLVYRPAETAFMAEAAKYGAVVKNGFEMLILQAEENWRLWNE